MATVYDVSSNPFLNNEKGKFQSLEDPDERESYCLVAEALLRVGENAVTEPTKLVTMQNAISLQVNFLLDQGMAPHIAAQTSQSSPGVTSTFRNRWLDPRAAALAANALGIEAVRFQPPMFGV